MTLNSKRAVKLPHVESRDKNTFLLVGDGHHWDLIVSKSWFTEEQLQEVDFAGKNFDPLVEGVVCHYKDLK